jgi:hypothetical protein
VVGLPSVHPVSHSSKKNANNNNFSPFLNASVFLLMSWFYNGSSVKSFADIDKLIHNVIRHEDFKASDLNATFSTACEAEWMDKDQITKPSVNSNENLPFRPEDGWNIGSMSIPVPCDGVYFTSEADAPRFIIDNIWYQQPLEVIKMAFTEPNTEKYHIIPLKE